MVGLLNYITFLLAFHVTYSEDNSTILFCNGINGGFCSKVLQPVEPFNSSKVAILDNKLSSVTCPPDGMKLVLFECTSWDRCDCNTTLEVYEQCFGNKLFCNELVTSYSTFTYKCNKELQLYCPSHTISTYKSTSRKSSTSTTTISSSDHFRNTTSKQTSTQTSQSTKTKISTTLTTISKELTTVSKESLPTHIPEPKYPKEEQKTKDAVNAVVIFSILCVVGATESVFTKIEDEEVAKYRRNMGMI
ncbi:uncharacterized protein LOC127738070 isoform X2 [Mytilus californianus]|uniref:uncharacterized protein LOC127738070 isoform X2 n=1 Tax=Mytilus californianus TaxID=6549 RepID=UPI002245AF0D|nr:uncharacterized protein LOC127738070 isoform X2 [Mytilus californianus]